jgi:hypothetical protein
MGSTEYEEGSELSRRVMGSTIVVVGTGFVVWFGCAIFFGSLKGVVFGMAQQHYATVVGFPCSGLGALFIVLLLRNAAGAIQFKVFALELKESKSRQRVAEPAKN